MPLITSDYETLKGKTQDKIIEFFLEQIYEGKKRKTTQRKSHLKIYVIKNNNFQLNNLDQILIDRYNRSDKNYKHFIDNNSFKTTKLSKKCYYLRIEHHHSKKKFHFVLIDESDYLMVLTLVNKKNLKGTIEKVIQSLPKLSFVTVSQFHLEELGKTEKFKGSIKGFIAKYQPEYRTGGRKITVDVHGGSLKDLNKIRTMFPVEPTTIRFVKINSPSVVGSVFHNGFFTLERIDKGGLSSGKKTINTVKKYFVDVNEDMFESVVHSVNEVVLSPSKMSFILPSEFYIKMKIKPGRFRKENQDETSWSELSKFIKQYFSNRKKRYFHYSDNEFVHMIYDRITNNKVQISLEPKYGLLMIYPFKNCNPVTLRDICNGITGSVESSFEMINPMTIKLCLEQFGAFMGDGDLDSDINELKWINLFNSAIYNDVSSEPLTQFGYEIFSYPVVGGEKPDFLLYSPEKKYAFLVEVKGGKYIEEEDIKQISRFQGVSDAVIEDFLKNEELSRFEVQNHSTAIVYPKTTIENCLESDKNRDRVEQIQQDFVLLSIFPEEILFASNSDKITWDQKLKEILRKENGIKVFSNPKQRFIYFSDNPTLEGIAWGMIGWISDKFFRGEPIDEYLFDIKTFREETIIKHVSKINQSFAFFTENNYCTQDNIFKRDKVENMLIKKREVIKDQIKKFDFKKKKPKTIKRTLTEFMNS